MKKTILIACLCIGMVVCLSFVVFGEPEYTQEDINLLVIKHEQELDEIKSRFDPPETEDDAKHDSGELNYPEETERLKGQMREAERLANEAAERYGLN